MMQALHAAARPDPYRPVAHIDAQVPVQDEPASPDSVRLIAEIDGALVEYELAAGQQLVVDTGNVAGFTAGVQMEIRQVPGMKNKLLGGEGLFNTLLTGPGRVWLQTMPISSIAASIQPFISTGSGN